jgi:hypothetical protein
VPKCCWRPAGQQTLAASLSRLSSWFLLQGCRACNTVCESFLSCSCVVTSSSVCALCIAPHAMLHASLRGCWLLSHKVPASHPWGPVEHIMLGWRGLTGAWVLTGGDLVVLPTSPQATHLQASCTQWASSSPLADIGACLAESGCEGPIQGQ